MSMVNANDYGRALYELAREQNAQDEILEQMRDVRAILEKTPEYVRLLDTPALPMEQRLSLLDEAFGSLNPWHLNFLKILCEKHAIKQYDACAQCFSELHDEARHILRATALTAVAMTDKQVEALTRKLETITGKRVVLTNKVDPQVLGGVTLRFGGVQLDGSLQSRLEDLRRSLAGEIV